MRGQDALATQGRDALATKKPKMRLPCVANPGAGTAGLARVSWGGWRRLEAVVFGWSKTDGRSDNSKDQPQEGL